MSTMTRSDPARGLRAAARGHSAVAGRVALCAALLFSAVTRLAAAEPGETVERLETRRARKYSTSRRVQLELGEQRLAIEPRPLRLRDRVRGAVRGVLESLHLVEKKERGGPHELVLKRGGKTLAKLERGRSVTIGREALGGDALNDTVSRKHLRVSVSSDGKNVALEDLGSVNGTRVSGRRVLDIESGSKSHIGGRTENQDLAASFEVADGEMHLVLDGMGGHEGGREAAEVGETAMRNSLQRLLRGGVERRTALAQSAEAAHGAIKGSSRVAEGGGATLAGVLVDPTEAEAQVIHAGDARAYRLRNGKLERLTTDHSFVQRMLEVGNLTAEQAANHPLRNVVVKALGQDDARVDATVSETLTLRPFDRLLLVSDGVWGELADHEIERIMSSAPTAQAAADLLVQGALEAASFEGDNKTAHAIFVE